MRAKRARFGLALLVTLAALVAAAGCGDDGSPSSATSPGTTSADRTASFRGVTADAVKVGVPLLDFKAIEQYVDFKRPDGKTVYQTFVDYYNAHGGINGRKIDPVYEVYNPVDSAAALAVCTRFTEDEEVFAVVGIFYDIGGAGDAQLCVTREHETILVGTDLSQDWIDKAPPGLLVTDAVTPERTLSALMSALGQAETLRGQKVGVLADGVTQARAKDVVSPALSDQGAERGTLAVLDIVGEDTAAAQAQLDAYVERWRTEKIDALIMVGEKVAAKQFVEKIKASLPDLLLIADSGTSVETAATDETAAGRDPNPYEGALAIGGLNSTDGEQIKDPGMQRCIKIWESAHPELKAIDPMLRKPGSDGKRLETYEAVQDACTQFEVFRQIAERAGSNLTNATWQHAVDTYGPIKLPATAYSSFAKGKYDADDGFRLREWDSTIGETGGWKNLTEIYNTAEDASAG